MSEPTPVLQIGKLRLWTPVILAPMAGVTNAPYRRLCREFGESGLPPQLQKQMEQAKPGIDAPAGLYVSEMITSRALVEETPETLRMIRPDPQERVRSVQLYGVNAKTMGLAAKMLCDRGLADHIDLNFGCPVPKVTRQGGGAALPWKLDLFRAILENVTAAAQEFDVPVTIKMRTGIDNEHLTYLDCARIAADVGVAAVALHARTAAQHYSGQAHWEQIQALVEQCPLPVLGNGDVFEAADANAMLQQTGCVGVVVGRGCQGRPWLFSDLSSHLHGNPQNLAPKLGQVVEVIEKHAQLMLAEFNDELRAMREMRKHLGWYLRGYPVGGEIRLRLSRVSTLDELHELLAGLDADSPYPPSAQGKRGRAGGEKRPHLPENWLRSRKLNEIERQRLLGAEVDTSGG